MRPSRVSGDRCSALMISVWLGVYVQGVYLAVVVLWCEMCWEKIVGKKRPACSLHCQFKYFVVKMSAGY